MLRLTIGAVAALAATSAFAGDVPDYVPASGSPVYSPKSMITGDVHIAGGYYTGNGGTGEITASGRVNIPLPWGSGLNEELEAAGLWEANGAYSAAGIFSHTYWKNQNFAAGFVLGASSIDSDPAYTVGGEAALFRQNTTFTGHISYTSFPADENFWTVAGEARVYLSPNNKVTGKVVWDNFAGDTDLMLQAAFDHRWEGSPLGAFASVAYFTRPGEWEFLVGVRGNFDQGGGTIQSHDYEVPFEAGRDISY